jgi:uncharacterized protein (DUF2267 family)
MKYEEFEKAVSRRAGVPQGRARVLTRATLETLADRLTRGEADDLAAQLPKQVEQWLIPATRPAEPFGVGEFINKVSERARVPPEDAQRAAQAVLATVREAVTGGEFQDVMAQLPDEFSELVRF